MTAAPARRYLSTAEAADYLGISVDALDRMASNRDITYVRRNSRRRAFDVRDLDAYMAERKVKAGTR